MSKYIDADRLKKEVKRLEKAAHKTALGCADSETRKFHEGKDFAYQHVGIFIDSLQQEQPEYEYIRKDALIDFLEALKAGKDDVLLSVNSLIDHLKYNPHWQMEE